MTIKIKKPLLGKQSVDEKFEEMQLEAEAMPTSEKEAAKEEQPAQELIPTPKQSLQIISEVEKEIKARRYVKERRQTGVKLDYDLHQEFRIACIRDGRTMEVILEEMVSNFVHKSQKRFEK